MNKENLKCNPSSYFLLDKQIKNSDIEIFSSVYHCEKLVLNKVTTGRMKGQIQLWNSKLYIMISD